MLDGLRDSDFVPRLCRSRSTQLSRSADELRTRLGRKASDAELAAELGLTVAGLDKWRREEKVVCAVSLCRPAIRNSVRPLERNNKEKRLGDLLADPRQSATRATQRRELMALVCRGLSRAERLLVILYYYKDFTMREIGDRLGVSESHVGQMHSALMRRCKANLAGRREEFSIP